MSFTIEITPQRDAKGARHQRLVGERAFPGRAGPRTPCGQRQAAGHSGGIANYVNGVNLFAVTNRAKCITIRDRSIAGSAMTSE